MGASHSDQEAPHTQIIHCSNIRRSEVSEKPPTPKQKKCRASQDIPTESANYQTKPSRTTHSSKVSKAPVPTEETPPPQVQKPTVRTRSGRLVKEPAYLKDYEH